MHVGFASVQMSSGHLLFKAPKSLILQQAGRENKGIMEL